MIIIIIDIVSSAAIPNWWTRILCKGHYIDFKLKLTKRGNLPLVIRGGHFKADDPKMFRYLLLLLVVIIKSTI